MKIAKLLAVSILSLFVIMGSANAANVVQTAKKAGKFNTLLAAAKAAGLVGALSHKKPITVFAPTDEAFADLPKGTVESLLKPKNREKLRAILLYHVVPGKIFAEDIPRDATKVKTLNGKKVRARRGLFSVRINRARVKAADIKASNGVVHVIDRVLIPKKKKRKHH